jgi:N utilization substance protein B
VGNRRHLSRQLALQVLYAKEYMSADPGAIAQRLGESGLTGAKNWSAFSRDLVARTLENLTDLDAAIVAVLEHWRIERLSVVDRQILRLALCEMRYFADVPLRVTLDEYIELAKQFGTDDSSAFVNGVLDRLAKAHADKDFRQEPATRHSRPSSKTKAHE